MLQAVAEASGGMYFAATEATEAESLRLFAEALSRYIREFVEPLRDWNGRDIKHVPLLALYDAAGFTDELTATAADGRVLLVGLARLYS